LLLLLHVLLLLLYYSTHRMLIPRDFERLWLVDWLGGDLDRAFDADFLDISSFGKPRHFAEHLQKYFGKPASCCNGVSMCARNVVCMCYFAHTNKHTCTESRRSLLESGQRLTWCVRARVAIVKLDRHKMHLQNDRITKLITEEGQDLQLKLYAVRFFNESKFSTLARAPTSSTSLSPPLFLSFPSLGARKDLNGFS
jgi:hypothetical protein